MLIARCLLGAVLVAGLSTAVSARTKAPTLREKEQAACYHDATTLCGEFVPDEAKVTACMIKKRASVSPGCAVYFKKGAR